MLAVPFDHQVADRAKDVRVPHDSRIRAGLLTRHQPLETREEPLVIHVIRLGGTTREHGVSEKTVRRLVALRELLRRCEVAP
ncbi:MAG: hypothetical protein WCQ64_16685 [Acidobacteriota bacterium]